MQRQIANAGLLLRKRKLPQHRDHAGHHLAFGKAGEPETEVERIRHCSFFCEVKECAANSKSSTVLQPDCCPSERVVPMVSTTETAKYVKRPFILVENTRRLGDRRLSS